jgi:hypothetical protein
MKLLLIILHLFIGLSAAFCGFFMVKTNGLGIPLSYLEHSPFTSFTIPGLILLCIVGGTQLFAALWQLRGKIYAPEVSAIAGFGIMIWIYTELTMILQFSWLQHLYFYLGILILVVAFVQLRLQNKKEPT